MLTQNAIRARLAPHFPGEAERQLSIVFNSIRDDIAALKAWGDALATKLNGEAASGVTNFDTNYAGPTITSTGI